MSHISAARLLAFLSLGTLAAPAIAFGQEPINLRLLRLGQGGARVQVQTQVTTTILDVLQSNQPDATDEVYATNGTNVGLDDGVASATQSAEGIASCPIPIGNYDLLPQATADAVDDSLAATSDPATSTSAAQLDAGDTVIASFRDSFRVLPDPYNESITKGVLIGMIDIITVENDSDGEDLFADAIPSAKGVAGGLIVTVEAGVVSIESPAGCAVILFPENSAVNLIVRSTEVVAVDAIRPIEVEARTSSYAYTVLDSPPTVQCRATVAISSSIEVEALEPHSPDPDPTLEREYRDGSRETIETSECDC